MRDGEKNVKVLAKLLGVSESTLSRNLASMRQMEIVIPRRVGQKVFYRLENPKIIEAYDLMSQVLLEHLEGQADLIETAQRDGLIG